MGIFRNTVGVGVSLTRDSACGVVLSLADGKPHLVSSSHIPLGDDAVRALMEHKDSPSLSSAVERSLEGVPPGAPVTLALWESEVYSHIFEPPPEKADLLKVAREEAGRSFPDDLSSLAIDAHMVSERRAVVVGARQTLCSFLTRIVPPPDTIEPESFALVRGLTMGKDVSCTVFVAVGLRDSYAVVYDAEGFSETVVLEEKDRAIDDILAEKLATTREAAEALRKSDGISSAKKGSVGSLLSAEYTKAKKTLEGIVSRYKKKESPIERIVFVGAAMDTPGLVEFLSKTLKVEVVLGDPWADIDNVEKKVQRTTEYAAAVGAALRSLMPAESSGVSFPRERASIRVQEKSVLMPQPSQYMPPRIRTVSLDIVKNIFFKGLAIAGIAFLLGGVAVGGYRWYQSTPSREQSGVLPITVEKNVHLGVAPVPSDALPGTLHELTREATGTFLVTSPALRDARAAGMIVITNASSQDIILKKGTRLLHASGVVALLDQRTPIGAGKAVSVKATTESAGIAANIAPGLFTIPGLPASLRSKVTGESNKAFAGGVVQEKTVSDIDKGRALDALRSRLYAEVVSAWADQHPDDIFLEKPLHIEDLSSQFTLDADTKLFHATGSFVVKTVTVPRADVNNALEGVLQSKVGSEQVSLYEISLPHISFMRMLNPDMARIVISAEGTKR